MGSWFFSGCFSLGLLLPNSIFFFWCRFTSLCQKIRLPKLFQIKMLAHNWGGASSTRNETLIRMAGGGVSNKTDRLTSSLAYFAVLHSLNLKPEKVIIVCSVRYSESRSSWSTGKSWLSNKEVKLYLNALLACKVIIQSRASDHVRA